ncbi:Hypothetical predicted protein [Marmota monax]|uniref:Uncharacterized protein n=1 Tax=Marmota monax TaxID=9995 RepID=A0A5E4BY35_MARMO|nr:Hypothetical predicted protein [Marmota monax]
MQGQKEESPQTSRSPSSGRSCSLSPLDMDRPQLDDDHHTLDTGGRSRAQDLRGQSGVPRSAGGRGSIAAVHTEAWLQVQVLQLLTARPRAGNSTALSWFVNGKDAEES